MPTAQVTGLASGIDWQQTIQLLMQIESQPMVALEERKENYNSKLEAWQSINAKLLTLKSKMEAMDSLNEIVTKEATSSDTGVLTASANSAAATGSYSILVNQLALNDKWTHEGFIDSNSTAVTNAAATFSYDYEGTTYTVNVPAGSTLAELAQAINNDVNNPGIQATILNDGTNSATAYHLILSGETGDAHDITNIVHTLDNFSLDFTETQNAQDAQIRVDGYPPEPSWILSATNEVTDVISGVTLNLKTTSTEPVTVTITNDTDAAKEKIQDFVDAYNEVIALINSDVAYNADTQTAGILFGDASVIGIKSDLQAIIASTVPGLTDNALYKSLSEIGIKSGSGGLLTITDSKLTAALENDINSVGNLFALSSTSSNNNLTYFLSNNSTQGGIYTVVANFDESGNLLSTSTINGHPVQIQGEYLVGMEGYPEEGLRIKFTYPGGGAGTETAEIRLAKGDAVRIKDRVAFLTDPLDGTVKYAQEGIQDTIESIDNQIAQWEARLEIKQAQLERQFTAMETLISQLQGQGDYVSAMLSGL
jgi:flagellar hook-associated protein 2